MMRVSDAKEQLIRAGEQLFARNGVHRTKVREINELAKQRNASALHYHFGSRDGLLQAIFERHSGPIDGERAQRLLELGDAATIEQLVRAMLEPLASELSSSSGRDYLRIAPQLFHGEVSPPAMMLAYERAAAALTNLPEAVRYERVTSMLLAGSTLLAARAAAVEDGQVPALEQELFVSNLIDMATGMLTAGGANPL
jgi:AcrR family transcriptional regulator